MSEILLEVKFAEVDRSALSQFGVNILSLPGAKNIFSTSTQQFGPPSLIDHYNYDVIVNHDYFVDGGEAALRSATCSIFSSTARTSIWPRRFRRCSKKRIADFGRAECADRFGKGRCFPGGRSISVSGPAMHRRQRWALPELRFSSKNMASG